MYVGRYVHNVRAEYNCRWFNSQQLPGISLAPIAYKRTRDTNVREVRCALIDM